MPLELACGTPMTCLAAAELRPCCLAAPLPLPWRQKAAPDGSPTASAHPARFSPDDKFSKERVTIKKRFGILPTQLPPVEL